MTQTKINYMYSFQDLDRSKLFINSSEIHKTWASYGIASERYGDDFTRDDVISVIYELMTSKEFRSTACSSGQVSKVQTDITVNSGSIRLHGIRMVLSDPFSVRI